MYTGLELIELNYLVKRTGQSHTKTIPLLPVIKTANIVLEGPSTVTKKSDDGCHEADTRFCGCDGKCTCRKPERKVEVSVPE